MAGEFDILTLAHSNLLAYVRLQFPGYRIGAHHRSIAEALMACAKEKTLPRNDRVFQPEVAGRIFTYSRSCPVTPSTSISALLELAI